MIRNIKEIFLPKTIIQKSYFLQDPGYVNRVTSACCMMGVLIFNVKGVKGSAPIYIHSMAFVSTESKVYLNNNVASNMKPLNYMKLQIMYCTYFELSHTLN